MLLDEIFTRKQARWFVIQNDKVILSTNKDVFLRSTHITNMHPHFSRFFFLSNVNGIEYFAAELAKSFDLNSQFTDIHFKQALSIIPPELYAISTKAYSILHWDKSHQFCGYCGIATIPKNGRFERVCPMCKVSLFPRISPSIIVLIHRGDQLVMARSPHFPEGRYGLIAGYVEVGETIEEAIHREIKEEIGLRVKNAVYVGSQPWPFPDALMLAFTAEYDSGEIVIDGEEIEAAGWYRYDNLPGRPSTSISIASKLLDDFIQHCMAREEESDQQFK